MTATSINIFWQECRSAIPGLPEEVPEAWAFGATPAHADELLALVLDRTKTATASSLWDYEHSGEALPEPGLLNIILDGRGNPRALLETTTITILPFNEVSESHAYAEGEDDRTLARGGRCMSASGESTLPVPEDSQEICRWCARSSVLSTHEQDWAKQLSCWHRAVTPHQLEHYSQPSRSALSSAALLLETSSFR